VALKTRALGSAVLPTKFNLLVGRHPEQVRPEPQCILTLTAAGDLDGVEDVEKP
jgi:hypothetical protein